MRRISGELKRADSLINDAKKKNDKLADYDEKVRDPMIDKYKKMKKK